MSVTDLIFILFALISLISGVVVVFARKIVVSAFSLLFTFSGVAGLYILLGADFLGMTQLLIYVGGILVLLLFAVIMTPNIMRSEIDMEKPVVPLGLATLVCLIFGGFLGWMFLNAPWHMAGPRTIEPTSETIGKLLMTEYLLPFEIASILLLVALIGGVFFAREEE